MTRLRLTQKRILVTRAAHQAGKLSEGLRAAGAEPVEVPVLEIQPPHSYHPLDTALRNLGSYNWLILTSANAVHAIVVRAAASGIVFNEPKLQIAAVGKATAEAAREAGFTVAVTPTEYVAESLIDSLTNSTKGQRVLIVDDLLATGGTAEATAKLAEKLGANIAGLGFVVELEFLKGRERLKEYDVMSLLRYTS